MSKKLLIISSSPRKGGNSDVLCDRFAQGAKEAGNEVEKVFLKDYKINYCTGCGTCFKGKPCPQKDDADKIVQKMIDADIILMATPVYFYTMCGQMKTFIDRCCARYMEIENKKFYFIMTAADPNMSALKRTLESLRGFTSCLSDIEEKGVIYGTSLTDVGDVLKDNAVLEQAYSMGNKI
ncbi:flavodoxin family protein [Candidatus Methanomassiliicoccus intestinalis]|uniref:flavodoxin family protein n=1 Tax=Candidatus Methanomassiliicoccus intestinalis TaxID=1406512 RepID=UPI0037DD630E